MQTINCKWCGNLQGNLCNENKKTNRKASQTEERMFVGAHQELPINRRVTILRKRLYDYSLRKWNPHSMKCVVKKTQVVIQNNFKHVFKTAHFYSFYIFKQIFFGRTERMILMNWIYYSWEWCMWQRPLNSSKEISLKARVWSFRLQNHNIPMHKTYSKNWNKLRSSNGYSSTVIENLASLTLCTHNKTLYVWLIS